jgi:dGTPase
VYDNTRMERSFEKIYNLIWDLYNYFVKHPKELEKEMGLSPEKIGVHRLACDYIAGMTDRYAIFTFKRLFLPSSWAIF